MTHALYLLDVWHRLCLFFPDVAHLAHKSSGLLRILCILTRWSIVAKSLSSSFPICNPVKAQRQGQTTAGELKLTTSFFMRSYSDFRNGLLKKIDECWRRLAGLHWYTSQGVDQDSFLQARQDLDQPLCAAPVLSVDSCPTPLQSPSTENDETHLCATTGV